MNGTRDEVTEQDDTSEVEIAHGVEREWACPACDGLGTMECDEHYADEPGALEACPACKGTDVMDCQDCNGHGWVGYDPGYDVPTRLVHAGTGEPVLQERKPAMRSAGSRMVMPPGEDNPTVSWLLALNSVSLAAAWRERPQA